MIRMRNRWTALAAGSVLLVVAAVAGLADSGTAALQVKPTNTAPPRSRGRPRGFGRDRNHWHLDGHATDHVHVPVAPLRRAGEQLRKHRRRDPDDVHAEEAGRRQHGPLSPTTARNSDVAKTTTATSAQTAVVKARPAASGCGGNAPLQIAGIAPPDHLVIDGQSINPNPVTRNTSSLTVRFHVSCKGKSVQGALVERDGCSLQPVRHPGRAGDRLRRLGAADDEPGQCVPGRGGASSSS